jgi:hypothetical protein
MSETNKDRRRLLQKGSVRRPGRRCLPALCCFHLSPAQSADRRRHGRREEVRYLNHVIRMLAARSSVSLLTATTWHGLSLEGKIQERYGWPKLGPSRRRRLVWVLVTGEVATNVLQTKR